jgi:hypothetical protein
MPHALRALLIGIVVGCLTGCFVSPVPSGEPVYEPPYVVAEPSASVFVWWPWPHYDVEHHYVIENDRVVIRDRHYGPFPRRTRPYIRNDRGNHRGWYRHQD